MSSNDPLSRDVARRRGEKVPALRLAVSGADRAGWQEATNFLTAAVGLLQDYKCWFPLLSVLCQLMGLAATSQTSKI